MKTLAVDRAETAHIAESQSSPPERWRASLTLGFAKDQATTRLIDRLHHGPLRVQKSLYPEGSEICHAIIVHPPGGVVGGDELSIKASVGDNAHALLATPGAAKWYKANHHESQQHVSFDVRAGAKLEYLPQESIFFNDSRVRLNQEIQLAADSIYLGCEILCFGRSASGEEFKRGRIKQATSIRRAGKLIWFEQGSIDADAHSMHSPLALDGFTVCATMLATGKPIGADLLNALREEAAGMSREPAQFGATQLKHLTVIRYLGNSSEVARKMMVTAWRHLRPAMFGIEANVPRIWNT